MNLRWNKWIGRACLAVAVPTFGIDVWVCYTTYHDSVGAIGYLILIFVIVFYTYLTEKWHGALREAWRYNTCLDIEMKILKTLDDAQYRITKDWATKFKQAIESHSEREGVDPLIAHAERDALESEYKMLIEQLVKYESFLKEIRDGNEDIHDD